LSAFYPAAVAPLPLCLILPPAAMAARPRCAKKEVSRQKSCETKGLEQDSIHLKSDRALRFLARGADELAANYQDAVKGVLTLSPRRWGMEPSLFWPGSCLKREHERGRPVALARRLRLRAWPEQNIVLLRRWHPCLHDKEGHP
jgi:hypothetical protein